MGGPAFTGTDLSVTNGNLIATNGNLIINVADANVRLNDTGTATHVWEMIASSETWQLQDITNSAIRIIVDANGRVGFNASVSDLSPNRLTLKDSLTCLGLINGTADARITGSVDMIGGIQNVAPSSGNKWRGLSIRPFFATGAGQIDVIGIGANFGPAPVLSITRSGSTATVTTGYVANGNTYNVDHGYATGGSVTISGAAQTEYNGTFTITATGTNTFTYAVTGTPATPATGAIYQTLSGWNTASEAGLFIGDILSAGSASSYGCHVGIVTVADPSGTAKERGLLVTIDRRPGCPVGSEPDSFSRGIEVNSAGSIADYSDNLTAGDGIVIFGQWHVGIRVDPLAQYNGFGTLTPDARLHVGGDGDETIKLETTGGSGSAWSLSVMTADGSLRLSTGTTEAARFAQTSGAFRTGYGADSTSYTQSNANLLGGDNVEALGVVGTTGVTNINMYTQGVADRRCAIQAGTTGSYGGQLRFFLRANVASPSPDVVQAAYFDQDGGLVVGTAAGGSQGAGTINVAGDIYKNGTAYTNPDYVFEHWMSGRSDAAYEGPVPLSELRAHLRSRGRLPGIGDEPTGMFARGDVLLEKIEEAYLYIIELHDRIEQLSKAR